MSLSEIVSSVVQPLADLVPRLSRRPATNEIGVSDSWLFGVKEFECPLLYLPVMTQVEYYPKANHPIDTGLQSLTSADNLSVAVNATVIVKVIDAILLRSKVDHEDWESYAAQLVRACVQDVVCGSNWSQILSDGSEFVLEDAYDALYASGVEVCTVVLEDATQAIPIRMLSAFQGD